MLATRRTIHRANTLSKNPGKMVTISKRILHMIGADRAIYT